MLEAAGNRIAAKQYVDNAKQFRRAYDDMCAGVPGLEPRLERMRACKNVSGKTVDNYGKSGIIKEKSIKPSEYKRFNINDQKGYDDWVNKYYSKNKPKLTPRDIETLKTYTDGSYTAINAATRFEKGSEQYNKICRQYGETNLDKYKKISDNISMAIKNLNLMMILYVIDMYRKLIISQEQHLL